MKSTALNVADVNLDELLNRTANGEEFEILRNGLPVGRLIPPPRVHDQVAAQAAATRLISLVKRWKLTSEEVREWKHEGHRL